MLQAKVKNIYTKSRSDADAGSPAGMFRCVVPAKRSGAVWLIPLVISAVWLAVIAGIVIKVVLPQLGYDVPAGAIAGGAVLLWLILVLCVRSSIRRINPVVQFSCEGGTFSVLLSDGTQHNYPLDEIALRPHRVRRINHAKPVRNNHLQLFVKTGRKTVTYDVHVENEETFFSYISAVQRRTNP